MGFRQNKEWGKAPRAIPKKQEEQLNHQVSRGRRPLLQKAKKDIQSLKRQLLQVLPSSPGEEYGCAWR